MSSDFAGTASMSSSPLSAAVVTRACANNNFGQCWGYVEPLTNGDGIPCQDISHDNGIGNQRNYDSALNAARALADATTGTGKSQSRGGSPPL